MFFQALNLDNVIDIINNALRGLFGFLCEIIYPGIAGLYDLFKELGTQLYIDDFVTIYNKISLIIGIFMVFRVTFWLIESLINPDTISDKEKNPGKIIQKVLISVVLLATTPTIFKYAFDIQNKIIGSNIIENVMSIGTQNNDTTVGRYLASELFINFYTPTITEENGIDKQVETDCTTFYTGRDGVNYSDLYNYGKLDNLNNHCLTKKINNDDTKEYEINFNGLFATGVGGFVFWMILMYCISIAARYVQLIYLQVIAPIPIMGYLAPGKDNMFSKWVKQCTTTYLDLFIRLAIINFVMLLCNMLLSNHSNIISNFGSEASSGWITIFLVLGLLTFAKKAPELIQELLPKSVTKASGDFGLSWKKRTDGMLGGKLVYGASRAATYGVAGAGITGAVGFLGGRGVKGRLAGLVGGVGRGIANGAKSGSAIKNLQTGIKQQSEMNRKRIDWASNGSTWGGRMAQRMSNVLGYIGPAEDFDNQVAEKDKLITQHKEYIAPIKRKISAYNDISKAKGDIEDRATKCLLEKTRPSNVILAQYYDNVQNAKAMLEAAQSRGDENAIKIARDNYANVLKENKENYITHVMNNRDSDKNMSSILARLESVIKNNKEGAFDIEAEVEVNGVITRQSIKDWDFTNFDILDKIESTTTNQTQEYTYTGYEYVDEEGNTQTYVGGVAATERDIQTAEDEKNAIKSSDEYKAAQADRNAVGGHKGGK